MGVGAVIRSDGPVALIGGGAVPEGVADRLLARGGPVVAADGGAEYLLDRGRVPDAVIGDMDSLDPARATGLPPGVLHPVDEQESTDFEKCLARIDAPLVLGAGFLGARVDHMLAALSVLVRLSDRRCILAGDEDAIFLAPPALALDRPVGERLSLFPMAPVTGRSRGLDWPIEGLSFAPGGQVGTSNRVCGKLWLEFDAPAMLIILPVAALEDVAASLAACPARWPARAG